MMRQPSRSVVADETLDETYTREDEFDDIERDLQAKERVRNKATVDDLTKMQLAKGASHASLPGVVVGNPVRSKPDAGQMEEMGNWRLIQKNRRAERHREEYRPEPISVNEEHPLDDFQGNMKEFQIKENQKTKIEDEELRKHNKKRLTWITVAVLAFVTAVGIGVGVAVGIGGSSGQKVDVETTSFHDCHMQNHTRQSDRFFELSKAVSAAQGWDPSSIDSLGSSQRAALCWLSNVDSIEVDVMEGSEYEVVQRFALAAIYYHFVGTSLEIESQEMLGSNWLDTVHVCEWDFVGCDGPDDRVTELFLDGIDLNKPIPEEMALMSNLMYLKISRGGLTGQIPSSLSLLTQLQALDLLSNALTGTIPPELGSLLELRILYFDNNELNGDIAPQLFEIPHLLDLSLAFNLMSGTLPNALGNATELTLFSVEANRLVGTIPDISRLTRLEYFSLGENLLDDAFPDVSRLTNLVSLRFGGIYLAGTIPSAIWFFPRLERLDLGSAFGVSGTIPAEVGLLTTLRVLDLGSTEIAGSIPPTLGNLSNLLRLSLYGLDGLSGTIPTELGRLTNLEKLILPQSSNLSGTMPDEVCDLRTHGTLLNQEAVEGNDAVTPPSGYPHVTECG